LDKVYDTTTAATIIGTLTGVFASDVVTLSWVGNFDNKNVGNNKPVTASFVIGGADSGNYTLAQPTGLTASITPAYLTLYSVTDTKVYDGSTTSTATPLVNGLLGTDTINRPLPGL